MWDPVFSLLVNQICVSNELVFLLPGSTAGKSNGKTKIKIIPRNRAVSEHQETEINVLSVQSIDKSNLKNFHFTSNRKLDMKHLPIWIDNLEITENDLTFSSLDCGQLQLTNLNIANNLFTSIPASLPCLAPNLTRLNISYNSLRYEPSTPQWK